jgi:hypothetical protein
MGNSPLRPLVLGIVVGFVIGLMLGLIYAWQINPAVYSDGARFNNLNSAYLDSYVETVSEAYLTNRDVNVARTRLADLAPAQKVALLAKAEAKFRQTDAVKADGVGQLAVELNTLEGWSQQAISQGLTTGNASEAFANRLGQAPVAPAPDGEQPPAATPPAEEGGGLGGVIRWIGIILLLLVVVVIFLFLMTRFGKDRKTINVSTLPSEAPEVINEEGETLQPLRQWVGTYNLGQDNYDESFTVETPESDFLGECGMGILEGFASGSPKKVAAFDVWLFDKTDIRTVSMPVMSRFAFEDDILRGKVSSDATPVLAAAGFTFDIETTALLVKATIDEVVYGDEAPAESYFETLKISLTAYLKPGADVKGDMPLPEGFDPIN